MGVTPQNHEGCFSPHWRLLISSQEAQFEAAASGTSPRTDSTIQMRLFDGGYILVLSTISKNSYKHWLLSNTNVFGTL